MPLLCYHSVNPDWETAIAVDPNTFTRQCEWLARRRHVVPVADLLAAASGQSRLPSAAVGLTFDDGFADFYDHAMPALTRYRLPATMYVVAKSLEGGSAHADWLRPQPSPAPATLTREQILELQDLGVQFESHSWAHHDLRTLGEQECVRDLRDSRDCLEALLGRRVRTLAYPYGFHAPHVRRAAAAAGVEFALSLPEGREEKGRYAVPRAGIYRGNSLTVLRVKSSRFYLSARMSRLSALIAR